jgi:biotin transport system substrate-specific component
MSIHRLAWISLMAALAAAGGALAIPVNPFSPAPITMQTLFVLLSGLILGPRGGAAAMLLYLLAGAAGLPVFAGGKAGLAVLVGPSGGFLIGFVPAAATCGLAKRTPPRSAPVLMAFCLLATAETLGLGALRLSAVLGLSLEKAAAAGILPFLPGAALKIIAAAALYRLMAARRLLPL